jgi:hypothetical protein
MKLGTIASLWRYDASAYRGFRSSNLRQRPILHCAQWPNRRLLHLNNQFSQPAAGATGSKPHRGANPRPAVLSERALNTEEIADTLIVTRSTVSTGLKDLQGLRPRHGEPCDGLPP